MFCINLRFSIFVYLLQVFSFHIWRFCDLIRCSWITSLCNSWEKVSRKLSIIFTWQFLEWRSRNFKTFYCMLCYRDFSSVLIFIFFSEVSHSQGYVRCFIETFVWYGANCWVIKKQVIFSEWPRRVHYWIIQCLYGIFWYGGSNLVGVMKIS